MSQLRVLHVEDSDDDAALVLRELRRAGIDPIYERVQTQAEFKAAVREKDWDVILSDFSLPLYTGMNVLNDTRECGKDIPFILVSGTIGEKAAVNTMRAGAHDFVLKDQLARLPAAIEREVREAQIRAEREQMREQLVISERMASAGALAAGVAHEINNPLAVVVSNLDFIIGTLGRLPQEANALAAKDGSGKTPIGGWLEGRLNEVNEPLQDVCEAIHRIRDIVRDVKMFSRPQEEERGPVDIRRVIESSIRMAWNEIRHRASLVRDYSDIPMVEANEARLGQVLLNLLVNAAQAMPEGHADKNEIRVGTRVDEKGQIVIEVKDTGSGIPKQIVERIFDPFFTTKPAGVGTGLGLAICRRIINDLGGTIGVESEQGKGTTFRVIFPEAKTEAKQNENGSIAPETVRRARILVVDDEPSIGRAIERSLARHHDVASLTSGKQAIAQIESGALFDVIISDLMMPEVSGMEIYEVLSRVSPQHAERMIFLTGGAFTTKAREFLDEVPNPRIEKPFEVGNLLAVIAGVLR